MRLHRVETTQRKKRKKRKGTGKEIPQGDTGRYSPRGGGHASPPEENADLPEFILGRVHLLLQEVYGGFLHHNDESHLDGGFTDNAI